MKVKVKEGFDSVEVIIKCPEITNEIRKLELLLRGDEQRFLCSKDNTTHVVDKNDIYYFESVDKRCFLYTAEDIYETPLRLYEIEEILSIGFLRNAKSQIVNIAKIKSLCPDFGGRIEVIMDNGEKLIVSRQYAKLLKERLGLK